jgi:hypothetical protein
MQVNGEEQTLNEIFKLMNDNLTFVVNSQETNEQNLLFLFDIIFNFLKFSPGKTRNFTFSCFVFYSFMRNEK